jgi:hypothetical protein
VVVRSRVTDPAVEPEPRPQQPQTSLSALATSRRPTLPTLPATPVARQRGGLFRSRNVRWTCVGLLLSLAPVAALSQRESSKPQLTRHILHGAAEIKRAPNGDQVRWRLSKTEIRIDGSIDRYGPRAREAVQRAFGTWLELGTHTPELSFDTASASKLSLEPDGKNSVLVAPITLPGHEDDLAITLAFWDERTGSIAEADIVINAKVNFEVMEADPDDDVRLDGADNAQEHRQCVAGSYDLQNVLTHEVGHFMGLGEELKEDGASMFYRSHRCETQKRTLASSDQHSVVTLYDAPASEDPSEAQAAGCALSGRAPSSNDGLSLMACAGLAAMAFRRRR